MAAALRENKILKIDDNIVDKRTGEKLDSWREFFRAFNIFKAAGTGQLLVDWSIFRNRGISDKKLGKLLKFAKRKKVLVHAAFVADGNTKTGDLLKLYELGFASIGLDLKGVSEKKAGELLKGLEGRPLLYVKAADGVSLPSVTPIERLTPQMVENRQFNADAVLDAELPQFTDHEALTRYLENLPAEATIIFHSQDVEDLIRAARDITDKQALVSFLNILVNLGTQKISTPEQARRLGYNWPVQSLPVLDRSEMEALLRGNMDDAHLGVKSAIREQADEFTDKELKTAFLNAIAETILIRARLEMKDKALGAAYAKGTLKIIDPRQRELLGKALAREALMNKNELKEDWRAARSIKKASYTSFDSLLLELGKDLANEKPQPGTVTAVIDILLDSIVTDFNLKQSAKEQKVPFDAEAVKHILAAA